ncbi:Transporter of the ATP-binding cassette (ABC), partial [Coemansia sp. RSA 2559]
MSIRVQATVAATVAALATALFAWTLAAHVAGYLFGDRAAKCGGDGGSSSDGPEWEWGSVDSDCFRAGFLWPAIVLLASTLVSAAFTLCLALPPVLAADGDDEGFATDGSAPLARLGVGAMRKALRRPRGASVLVDNRVRVGAWVVALLGVQTTLFGSWWVAARKDTNSAPEMQRLPGLLAQTAGLLTIAALACVRTLMLNGRRVYAGLFPWVLPALESVLLVVCAGEAYASFFTPRNAAVPIVGPRASARSNLLVASVAVSAVLVFLFANAQQRPIFMRPRENATEASPDLVENNDNGNSDDESTPISAPGDIKERDLLEAPESNVSWLSRATFAWLDESMRIGATRRMEYTDLYRLSPEDSPVSCWRRYQQHRKPGRPLLVAIAMTLAPELFLQFSVSVILCAVQFSGPFFLQRILRTIQHLKHHRDNGKTMPDGIARSAYLDAAGLLVFTLLTSLLSSQVMWIGRHIGMRIKGIIISEMSAKTLRRRGKGSYAKTAGAATSDSVQQPQLAADGKIMNLLTTDFQRVVEVSTCLERVYAFPLTLVLGMWYMYRVLGVSALFGMSVAVVYVPLTRVLYKYLTRLENAATALSDDRVSAISEIVHGIRAVKLFGWESRFAASIDQKRELQLDMQWRVYLFMTLIHAVALLGPMLILIVMFAVYVVVLGNSLTAE